jgi:hypothetical protein
MQMMQGSTEKISRILSTWVMTIAPWKWKKNYELQLMKIAAWNFETLSLLIVKEKHSIQKNSLGIGYFSPWEWNKTMNCD